MITWNGIKSFLACFGVWLTIFIFANCFASTVNQAYINCVWAMIVVWILGDGICVATDLKEAEKKYRGTLCYRSKQT